MNIDFRDTAVAKWREYFPQAEMPIAVFYSDELCGAEYVPAPPQSKRGYVCLFAQLSKVHHETALAFAFDEASKENPRAILGGMDTAMRTCVKSDLLTFSFAASMFERMIANMDRSFLTTYIWKPLMNR